MSIEQIREILATREKAAEMNGNTTELRFIRELIKMTDDYKQTKERTNKR